MECLTKITKSQIDKLANKYETSDFIKDDPILFPHKFSNSKKDCEIAGFIASLMAYGNRKVFIKKLNELFDIAQNEPYNFVVNFEPKLLKDFNYRFGTTKDFSEIFTCLKELYSKDGGLEELFKFAHQNSEFCFNNGKKYIDFTPITDYFYSKFSENAGQGCYFMIPNPKNGGAMKRMNMLLRWFVRESEVDLGIWKFMTPSELLIPLDTHVARLSRELGLLGRKSNDFKAVLEITENLQKFDENDPIKYDFALFGYGVTEDRNSRGNEASKLLKM